MSENFGGKNYEDYFRTLEENLEKSRLNKNKPPERHNSAPEIRYKQKKKSINHFIPVISLVGVLIISVTIILVVTLSGSNNSKKSDFSKKNNSSVENSSVTSTNKKEENIPKEYYSFPHKISDLPGTNDAKYGIIIDKTTNKVIAARNPKERTYPASTTKIMTLLTAVDLITNYKHLGADIRLDPSRVASTIVSGIGFLGAGMIYVHKSSISGLTTAAGIFATAGIGMSIGAGMYVVGISATLIILFAQFLLHMKTRITTKINLTYFVVKDVTEKGYLKKLKAILSDKNITIYDYEIAKDDTGKYTYTLSIDIPESISAEDVLDMTEYECFIN